MRGHDIHRQPQASSQYGTIARDGKQHHTTLNFRGDYFMATEWSTDAGRRLRMLRRERGLTLRSLAAQLRVTHSIIGNWETGRIAPGRDMLGTLANFFGVRPEWLVSGAGPMQPDWSSPVHWPIDDLQAQWGVTATLPEDWPEPFRRFIAASAVFGIHPSAANLARMVAIARELGSADALPPEIQAAVESAGQSSDRGWRWHGLAEGFLRATNATLDAAEDIFRAKPNDS